MKRIIILSIMLSLVLGFTHCKKESAKPTGEGINITLNANCGGEKTNFIPGTGAFTWNGSTTNPEYIYVGGSESGYLGRLSSVDSGENASFSGSINPQNGETLYFFYLGSGDHEDYINLNLTNQVGDLGLLTNHHIAISDGIVYDGQTNFNVTLKLKVAIARFDTSGFTYNEMAESVSMYGENIYNTVTVNYNQGTITGNNKGAINIGDAITDKYVILVPSVSTASTINFESASYTGSIVFNSGIQAGQYYVKIETGNYFSLPIAINYKSFFSTSPQNRVVFSKGNLQYTRTSTEVDWNEGSWSFMEHQYDMVETSNVSANYTNQTAVGLFAWGQSGATDGANVLYPYLTSDNYCTQDIDLDNTNFDWGFRNSANITNGEGYTTWRTPSKAEYEWLLGIGNGEPEPGTNCRKVANRWLKARINAGGTNHNGLIIFPDLFSFDLSNYTCNSIANDFVDVTANDWTAMENAGAVFLPAAGHRFRGSFVINGVGYECNYWTSRGSAGESYAWQLASGDNYCQFNMPFKSNGFSVRLVRNVN